MYVYNIMNISIPGNTIIQPVTSWIDKGITGLMGPSGCGKTTLLNQTFYNNKNVAYVPQSICIYTHLTIEENIRYALQFSGEESNTDDVIKTMELEDCRNTISDNASGGEQKRCSIAIELSSSPSLFMFDEPFSSLDSHTTELMFNIIREKLKHIPVIMTIHQPNGYIFFNLQNLWIMSHGVVVYNGKPQDVKETFEYKGYRMRMYESVSEFAISCCQQMDNDTAKQHKAHLLTKDEEIEEILLNDKINTFEQLKRDLTSIIPLSNREIKQNIRNPSFLKSRIIQNIIFGFFVGLLFYDTGNEQVDVQNKTGAIFFIAINQIMANVFLTLQTFPESIKLFMYDFHRNKYPLWTYYIVKTTIDVPFQIIMTTIFGVIAVTMTNLTDNIFSMLYILGFIAVCSASFGYMVSTFNSDSRICLVIGNLCTLPMMLTSGYFINNRSVPSYIEWIRNINPFYYGFNAMSTVVWKDTRLNCGKSECLYTDGTDVINYQDIKTTDNVSILFALTLFYRLIGFIVLYFKLRAKQRVKTL